MIVYNRRWRRLATHMTSPLTIDASFAPIASREGLAGASTSDSKAHGCWNTIKWVVLGVVLVGAIATIFGLSIATYNNVEDLSTGGTMVDMSGLHSDELKAKMTFAATPPMDLVVYSNGNGHHMKLTLKTSKPNDMFEFTATSHSFCNDNLVGIELEDLQITICNETIAAEDTESNEPVQTSRRDDLVGGTNSSRRYTMTPTGAPTLVDCPLLPDSRKRRRRRRASRRRSLYCDLKSSNPLGSPKYECESGDPPSQCNNGMDWIKANCYEYCAKCVAKPCKGTTRAVLHVKG